MPPGAAYVGRPSRWGNPFRGDDAADLYRRWIEGRMSAAEWQQRADGDGPQFWEAKLLRVEGGSMVADDFKITPAGRAAIGLQ